MLNLNNSFPYINKHRLNILLCILFLLFAVIPASAQNSFTISGNIKDAASGEALIGATVKVKELPQIATASNSYGF